MPSVKGFPPTMVQKLRFKPDGDNTHMRRLERGVALQLVVGKTTKTWRALVYTKGKPKTVKLGRFPQMKADEATKAALYYWEHRATIEAEAEAPKAGPVTFKDVASDWLEQHVEGRHLIAAGQFRRKLELYLNPNLGDLPFRDIGRDRIREMVKQIRHRNGAAQANAVFAVLRNIMRWYQADHEDYTSPIVPGMNRDKPRARDRVLSDEEIRLIWHACDAEGCFGSIVQLCLLTAQRSRKVSEMRWSDIDFREGVWSIRQKPREKGTAGVLVLPSQAMQIIEAQPRQEGDPFVFPGVAGKPFNNFSRSKARLDQRLSEMPNWTVHDLRRTARSLMPRVGVRPRRRRARPWACAGRRARNL